MGVFCCCVIFLLLKLRIACLEAESRCCRRCNSRRGHSSRECRLIPSAVSPVRAETVPQQKILILQSVIKISSAKCSGDNSALQQTDQSATVPFRSKGCRNRPEGIHVKKADELKERLDFGI